VGNLSFNTEEPQLEQLFSSHGAVESVHLVRDHVTGRSRGFAFVEMADDDAGRAACQALDQKDFEGRRLDVNEARPQERRGGGGGGFGGNGGGRNAAAVVAVAASDAGRSAKPGGERSYSLPPITSHRSISGFVINTKCAGLLSVTGS